jgi:protein-tyrosine phosphatase
MFHIIDNIYLSNRHDAANLQLIDSNDIQIVIRLSEDTNEVGRRPSGTFGPLSIYPEAIQFYNFELEDNCLFKSEMIQYSKLIKDIIIRNKHKHVLIHCNEGQSRSVSAIIYYLMTTYKIGFDASLAWVKKMKPDAKPNSAFETVLRAFDP